VLGNETNLRFFSSELLAKPNPARAGPLLLFSLSRKTAY
jgi:hypothetical protein